MSFRFFLSHCSLYVLRGGWGVKRGVMGGNDDEMVCIFSEGVSCLICRGDRNGQGE